MTESRQSIGEEMIIRVMQYCDGALDASEAEAMAREIAADPALQELANDFAASARAARDTMAVFGDQPIPLALARTVASASRPEARSTSPAPALRRQVAAALIGAILGAGILGIWSAGRQDEGLRLAGTKNVGTDTSADGAMSSTAFRSTLFMALNAGPQAHTRSFKIADQSTGGGELSVIRWFELAAGTSCAEFQYVEDEAATGSGIACRREDGGWDVIALPHASR
ncbi:hypothetical protein [Dongia sp.]|uniref:hypothetical protein n=1 Tax=Dongia sp. TaxID=1977262 RepID=UPI0035B48CB9